MHNSQKKKVSVENRKAGFDYQILDRIEAGMRLEGWQVKAMRLQAPTLQGTYVRELQGRFFWVGVHVKRPVQQGSASATDSVVDIELLLHRRQIRWLRDAVSKDGITIVPLTLKWEEGSKFKLDIGLAKGKKQHDKRAAQKERDILRSQG